MNDTAFRKHEQQTAYASPWTIRQRVRMIAWELCWALFCRWTPKPFNAWRVAWLKIFGAKVYGKPFVHQRARIQIPWNLILHDRAALGDGANAYSLGVIEIHREATVAQEAYLSTGTHDFADRNTPLVTAPITVGRLAWVGARAFVMPGVTVGEGAVLGAMSVATKDVPDWTICAGNPAKQIAARSKRRMRVNIVQGAFRAVPPIRGGAVEKVWYALGCELAKAGCEVTQISRLYAGLPAEEWLDGVRYLRVPGFDTCPGTVKLKLRDLRYALRVRRILPPADVTVTNTFWMPLLVRSFLHGAVYVHVARFPKGQMRLYRHVARLQPVSSVVGDAIKQQTPSVAHLVKVLPNPIPENWLADDRILAIPRKPTVLYVGRVHPEKGLDLLIDAFALLPKTVREQWTLSVVGPWDIDAGGGGEAYLADLKRRASDSDIQVEWVGPVYELDALKAQYDRAEIFVYPSRAAQGEALPLAPVEAMARGSAPIVSSLKCFSDYLRHGENGLVFASDTPDAAKALAAALSELIAAPEYRLRLRREALKTAASYTVDKIARQYLNDFEALIDD